MKVQEVLSGIIGRDRKIFVSVFFISQKTFRIFIPQVQTVETSVQSQCNCRISCYIGCAVDLNKQTIGGNKLPTQLSSFFLGVFISSNGQPIIPLKKVRFCKFLISLFVIGFFHLLEAFCGVVKGMQASIHSFLYMPNTVSFTYSSSLQGFEASILLNALLHLFSRYFCACTSLFSLTLQYGTQFELIPFCCLGLYRFAHIFAYGWQYLDMTIFCDRFNI